MKNIEWMKKYNVEAQVIELPPRIRVLREVTADYRYLNSSLSKAIPFDEIEKG